MAKPMYGRSLMLIAILNFGGIFGEFRAIHALSRAKSTSRLRTFPQFKVILFYVRYLKLIYVGNLGTIIVSRSDAFAAEY